LYDIDQAFGYYITTCFKNTEIQKYIDWARADDDDIYSNFELVYNEIIKQQAQNI
jgi:hypothetical protein